MHTRKSLKHKESKDNKLPPIPSLGLLHLLGQVETGYVYLKVLT